MLHSAMMRFVPHRILHSRGRGRHQRGLGRRGPDDQFKAHRVIRQA